MMIKIKNCIFPESELEYLREDNIAKRLYVKIKAQHDEIIFYGTLIEDIQWNYEYIKENTEEYIKLCNEYHRIEKRYKDLEEENKKINELVQFNVETSSTLTKRINNAIKYLEDKSVYHTIEQFYDVTLFDEELTNLFNILKGEKQNDI